MKQLILIAVVLHAVASVSAHPTFVKRIPNGDAIPGIAALGHVDPRGGGERNAFGKAFADAGFRWTRRLCELDVDGDGQTNGQELGDPCCSWTETGNLAYVAGLSNPADKTQTVDPRMYKHVQCTHAANFQNGRPRAQTPTPSLQRSTKNDSSLNGATTASEDAESLVETTTGNNARRLQNILSTTCVALSTVLLVSWVF